jgi:hypothetical protein
MELINDMQIAIYIRSGEDKKREKLYDNKAQKLSQDTILGE